MDSKLIEKVALALVKRKRELHGIKGSISIKTMKGEHKNQWEEYLDMAVTAISAIK